MPLPAPSAHNWYQGVPWGKPAFKQQRCYKSGQGHLTRVLYLLLQNFHPRFSKEKPLHGVCWEASKEHSNCQRQQKALRRLRNQATRAASKCEQALWKICFLYHLKVGTGKEDYLASLHLLLHICLEKNTQC